MRNIPHFIFYLLLGITQTISQPTNQSSFEKQKVTELDERTVDSLLNPQLKNALRAIMHHKPAKMSKKKATKLLLAAMDEAPPHIRSLVKFLIAYFKKNNYLFDKDKVMCRALDLAAITPLNLDYKNEKNHVKKPAFLLLEYLLHKEICNLNKLFNKPNKKSNFLWKLDWFHIIYISYKDATNIRFLPKPILKSWSIVWKLVQIVWWSVWIFRGFFWCCNKIFGVGSTPEGFFKRQDESIADFTKPVRFLFSIWVALGFFILRVLKVWYDSIQLTAPPGYLFYLFENIEEKNKSAVEAIALLLLKRNLCVNPVSLFIKKQDTSMVLGEGAPPLYTYTTLSVLHLAAKHDMLLLSKELIKSGAHTNTIANLAIKDRLDLKSLIEVQKVAEKANTMGLQGMRTLYNTTPKLLGAFKFITTKDLKKLKKGKKATPLDMAPKGSITARYLRACRGKNYRDIKAARKNNKRKRKNIYKKTGKKEASKVA